MDYNFTRLTGNLFHDSSPHSSTSCSAGLGVNTVAVAGAEAGVTLTGQLPPSTASISLLPHHPSITQSQITISCIS